MSFTIPDDLLQAARMSEEEMRQEIAVLLYQKEKLTLGQVCRFAQMSPLEFQQLVSSRGIPMHYGVHDFEQDLDTLRVLGRL